MVQSQEEELGRGQMIPSLRSLIVVWVTALTFVGLGCEAQNPTRTVIRVVDGDTIVLDGNEKVRLIGVDTPETVDPRRPVQRFGHEASEFTRRLALNQEVRLEYDQTLKDRYGRTLAYVYLRDGRMVNREIIRQGYGFAYTKYPFKYMKDFREAEAYARKAGTGLWSSR